jgi:hypothetical protein
MAVLGKLRKTLSTYLFKDRLSPMKSVLKSRIGQIKRSEKFQKLGDIFSKERISLRDTVTGAPNMREAFNQTSLAKLLKRGEKAGESFNSAFDVISRNRPFRAGMAVGSTAVKAPMYAAKKLAGFAVNHPIKTGTAFGVLYGGARASIEAADRRTEYMLTNQGMRHNNLSTDGLTLSLSKLRHRG